jgi:hypothetical protein
VVFLWFSKDNIYLIFLIEKNTVYLYSSLWLEFERQWLGVHISYNRKFQLIMFSYHTRFLIYVLIQMSFDLTHKVWVSSLKMLQKIYVHPGLHFQNDKYLWFFINTLHIKTYIPQTKFCTIWLKLIISVTTRINTTGISILDLIWLNLQSCNVMWVRLVYRGKTYSQRKTWRHFKCVLLTWRHAAFGPIMSWRITYTD